MCSDLEAKRRLVTFAAVAVVVAAAAAVVVVVAAAAVVVVAAAVAVNRSPTWLGHCPSYPTNPCLLLAVPLPSH